MISYNKWKETSLSITSISLDPHNPRLPESGYHLSQRDIIFDLVENEKVYDLAKNIVDNGYFPVESLIVVEEEKKKYVIEGNRRCAALKLLLSPLGAPAAWERRFRALANRANLDEIKKVKVLLAPSREAAASMIMAKHTQGQVESWSPIMQAKFYKGLVDSGLSPEEICTQHKVPLSEVTEALQRYTMYQIACSLDLPEETAQIVHNSRVFPITTLERLYRSTKVSKFLGIEFDKNKQLVGKVAVEEFKKGFSKIVTDIAKGDIHSRSINKVEHVDEYLDSFGSFRPDPTNKGEFNAETFFEDSSVLPAASAKREATRQRKASTSKKLVALIPPHVTCDLNNQRINDVLNELKDLRVAKYPNAVGLMFRSLLEMSLGYYLDRTGKLQELTQKIRDQKAKKNQNVPADWHPTLTQMLNHMTDPGTGIIKNGNILKALRKFAEDKDSFLSIDSLNLFVHNQYFHPTEEKLRLFWTQLEGLFQILLIEPDSDR